MFNWNWMLSVAAWMAGLNQSQLAKVKAAMPATHALIVTITKAQPIIEKIVPLANELAPLEQEAAPYIMDASKELKVVGPALAILLTAVEKHTATGKTQDQALAAISTTLAQI